MRKILLILSLIPISLQAAPSKSKLKFEPIYGVETALVRYPEPSRYITRATYGLRLMYGSNLLSSELELSQAKSREDYPGLDQKVEDRSDRAALGVRSSIPIGKIISSYLRAGGRASQGKSYVTTGGVEETKDNPLRVDPYAGAGLQLSLGGNLGINAGVTLIRNAENKYDSQYTLGLTGKFGNQ